MSIIAGITSFFLGRFAQTAAGRSAGGTAGSLVDAADGMRDAHQLAREADSGRDIFVGASGIVGGTIVAAAVGVSLPASVPAVLAGSVVIGVGWVVGAATEMLAAPVYDAAKSLATCINIFPGHSHAAQDAEYDEYSGGVERQGISPATREGALVQGDGYYSGNPIPLKDRSDYYGGGVEQQLELETGSTIGKALSNGFSPSEISGGTKSGFEENGPEGHSIDPGSSGRDFSNDPVHTRQGFEISKEVGGGVTRDYIERALNNGFSQEQITRGIKSGEELNGPENVYDPRGSSGTDKPIYDGGTDYSRDNLPYIDDNPPSGGGSSGGGGSVPVPRSKPDPSSGGGSSGGGSGGGSGSVPVPRAKPDPDEDKGSDGGGGKPVILDLDGDGIEVTELDRSTIYMDTEGDGFLRRTAWAGDGDGVLYFDPDGRDAITEKRQYVFTEWDPTATSDLEALASVFDTNGDGVLNAGDTDFSKFKLMVTNPDGTTTSKTLAELGITEIDLTADATNIELSDGSVITGQTTFKWADGSTGTVGDMLLAHEADGHRVRQIS